VVRVRPRAVRPPLDILAGLLIEAGTAANLVGDAHLAALAVERDATVVSFDTDFGRFAGVRRQIPPP
jgi:predicted nucleic acid-binding protein